MWSLVLLAVGAFGGFVFGKLVPTPTWDAKVYAYYARWTGVTKGVDLMAAKQAEQKDPPAT